MSVSPTITRFCHQTWQLSSSVQWVDRGEKYTYIVTESTPFHPISHIWPDHPADRGTLQTHSTSHTVENCLVGAVNSEDGTLFVDKAIPVKRDTPGWVFVVVHCLEGKVEIQVGDQVELEVDKVHQQALSCGHSAGHMAYLALNKVLTSENYWRKDADRKDPLGHYDFNSYAQESSLVSENRCVDTYRLGKTLRKRGLNSLELLENLTLIEDEVNQQLRQWLAMDPVIEMHCQGERLTDSRFWRCSLDNKQVIEIPCGGTHIDRFSANQTIVVKLKQLDAQHLEMQTNVIPQT